MRFHYNGHDFSIEFQRTHKMIPTGTDKEGNIVYEDSKYPYTTVIIYKWVEGENGKLVPEMYRTYTVGCYHKDHFTNEEGRKTALRCLCIGNSLTAGFKKVLWDTYLSRGKKA